MTTPSPLNEKERDELIAFLDGELEGPAAQAMEARIHNLERVLADDVRSPDHGPGHGPGQGSTPGWREQA